MTALLGAGVVVMIAADLVVGGRLILLSLRTRRLPEVALGSAVLLLGAVGYPLAIAARNGMAGSPEACSQLLGAALGFQNLGCAAMALATLWTFRPGVGWARGLAGTLGLLLAGSWLAQAAIGDFAGPSGHSVSYWVGFGARALAFVWSAAESWHYFALLRKRLDFGLTDAVVTDRFRLWAVCATAVVFGFAVFGCALILGLEVATSPWVLLPTSLAGYVSGITLWLAFLPPAWYLRRFQEA